MALNFGAIGNRNLNQAELGQLKAGHGVDVAARGYEGGAIGNTGYQAYHTGTGWGVRQPGQQPGAPGAPAAPAAPQGPQTAGQALTQNATVGAAPAQGSQTNVAGAFQQALMNKLAPQGASLSIPEIAPALQANRLSEQRGMERERAMLAERAAATGTNMSGGFESDLLGLAQNRAQREGQFAGGLVRDLGARQSAEQMSALGLGGQMLGQQDQLNQSRYGMDLDASLRREGLGAQTALGQGDLSLRRDLGNGNLNLGLLGLLQNGTQFGQSLGAQLGMFGANLNQQALLEILGRDW